MERRLSAVHLDFDSVLVTEFDNFFHIIIDVRMDLNPW
jgi:hypothetical protein